MGQPIMSAATFDGKPLTYEMFRHDYEVLTLNRREEGISEWRDGQRAFNMLHNLRPDLAEVVRGEVNDPFYSDDNLPSFWQWLEASWDSK